MQLIIGTWLISVVAILTGLVGSTLVELRYVSILFPVFLYALFELFPVIFIEKLSHHWTSLGALIIAGVIAYVYLPNDEVTVFPENLQAPLSCALSIHQPNAIWVSAYWPAKILFELNDRRMSLYQIMPDTTNACDWIVNPAWRHIVKHPKTAFISTFQFQPKKLHEILRLPGARRLCGGSIIQAPFNQQLRAVIPVLQKMSTSH